MANSCGNTNLNPEVPCPELDGQYKKPFLLADGYSIPDQTTAKGKTEWEDGIQSGNIIPLPKLHSTESQDSGAAYDSTPLGDITVSNGTISFMFMIAANTELYRKLASFSGATNYSLVLATASGKLKMLKDPTDGSLSGFSIGLLNVENPTLNDGSVAEKAPVKITLDDISEFRNSALVFKPTFNPSSLKALSDITIVIDGTPSATQIEFYVYRASANEDVQLANPQYSMVAADFLLKTTAGASQVIDGVSGGDVAAGGKYTLTGTGLVTGLLGCVDPSLMTTKKLSNIADVVVTI